jgi:hypothetical protein
MSICSGANAHVIPWWNPEEKGIFTTYRCGACWVRALDETRDAVASGDAAIRESFHEFLERHGRVDEALVVRDASREKAIAALLQLLDDVRDQKIFFQP